MPTLAEIQAQIGTPLDDLEIELVRQIIGISGDADSEDYQDARSRILNLKPEQNRIVRVLTKQYLEDLAFDTTKVSGGSQGVDFSPMRDKEAVAQELKRIVYGIANLTDSDLVGGQIKSIPVTYKSGSSEFE